MNIYRTSGLVALALVAAAACSESGDPEANAGDDFMVAVGDSPTFDGCGSTGSIETYSWVIVEAPEEMADDAEKALKLDSSECSFELPAAMGLDEVGSWVIELTAENADTASADRVTVQVVEG